MALVIQWALWEWNAKICLEQTLILGVGAHISYNATSNEYAQKHILILLLKV